jgi:hypothetical protein
MKQSRPRLYLKWIATISLRATSPIWDTDGPFIEILCDIKHVHLARCSNQPQNKEQSWRSLGCNHFSGELERLPWAWLASLCEATDHRIAEEAICRTGHSPEQGFNDGC